MAPARRGWSRPAPCSSSSLRRFGLLALLVIVTLLARDLRVAELGAYGLVASLAGYLLVLRNSVASSAVRAMASAADVEERGRVFAAAAALTPWWGWPRGC